MLFLFGPTAVGKTGLLETLADRPVEVVSADSMQVYRGMDVGTAKPDPSFRSRVPHHLIDIRNPDEQYDVGAFVHDADEAIAAIHGRGRVPVVSGGTGYYFKHLFLGLPESPPSDPAVRAAVRERADREGLSALYAELGRVDPSTAARVGENDRYRITRALEVYEQTGRPLSSFAMVGEPRADLRVTSVCVTRDREELGVRIRRRVDEMFASGLRAEVERLVSAGYGPADPGLRAIGYREFFAEDGAVRPVGDDGAIAAEIARNTRRYAKRQETFFRQLPDVTEVRIRDEAIAGIAERLLGRLDSV
ncbi:MAG: tRNA (adenosine(37)-N6)-dimethylallyltransferase MiaA [Spirochaetota bacterium]